MVVRSTPASSSRCESCRARSARKLKKKAESPGWSRGLPLITVGSMNSSDTPRAQLSCTAAGGARGHPGRPGHLLAAGGVEQGARVVDVGVHAAVGDEPEQVHVPSPLACARERRDELLVLEERAVPNCEGEAR